MDEPCQQAGNGEENSVPPSADVVVNATTTSNPTGGHDTMKSKEEDNMADDSGGDYVDLEVTYHEDSALILPEEKQEPSGDEEDALDPKKEHQTTRTNHLVDTDNLADDEDEDDDEDDDDDAATAIRAPSSDDPSKSSIERLLALGYTEREALKALRVSGDDLNQAIGFLVMDEESRAAFLTESTRASSSDLVASSTAAAAATSELAAHPSTTTTLPRGMTKPHSPRAASGELKPGFVQVDSADTLVEMGYDRQQARLALAAAGGNLDRAVEILTSPHSAVILLRESERQALSARVERRQESDGVVAEVIIPHNSSTKLSPEAKRKLGIMFVCGIIILAVIVVVVIFVTKDDNDSPPQGVSSSNSHPLEIALSSYFPEEDYFPSSTEQKEALEWLIERDPMNLSGEEDVNLILQRYVLAILFNTTFEQIKEDETIDEADGDWLSASSICSWRGITCEDGPDPLFVTGMLNSVEVDSTLRISGTIASEIGLLTALTQLELTSSGALSGTIPSEVGQLTALKFLLLNDNRIRGTIPTELGNLSKLEILLLHGNRLSGQIPSELGRLTTELDFAYLQDNALSGPVPSELGLLTGLQGLELGCNNGLDPVLPPEVALLLNMTSVGFC